MSRTGRWSCPDTARALRRLPVAQREALILVAAGGFTCGEDAAAISGACLGTIKSRVARARAARCQAMLDGDDTLPQAQDGPSDPLADILAQLSALAPAGAILYGAGLIPRRQP